MNKRKLRISLISILSFSILLLLTLSLLYFALSSHIFLKSSIELNFDGNTISWDIEDDSLLDKGYFILFKGDRLIYRGRDKSFEDLNMLDIVPPEPIDSLNLDYERDLITLSWNKPQDLGSPNQYQIFFADNEGNYLVKSKLSSYDYVSGIKQYIISVGDISIKTKEEMAEIDRTALEEGRFKVDILAFDERNNISKSLDLSPLLNYELELSPRDDDLVVKNPDESQDYEYMLILNDRPISLTNKRFDIYDYLEDSKPPRMPEAFKTMEDYYKINFSWHETMDEPGSNDFYIMAIGKKYNNKVFSKNDKRDFISGLKGYYFAINSDKDYRLSKTDKFMEFNDPVYLLPLSEGSKRNLAKNSIHVIDEEREGMPYYFHLASVDNSMNISDTFSYEFIFNSPQYLRSLDGLFHRDGDLLEEKYDREKMALSRLPRNLTQFIRDTELEIFFTDDEMLGYLYDEDTDDYNEFQAAGQYFSYSHEIYISNETYMDMVIIHELGHAIDYIPEEDMWYSDHDDFYRIYMKEKESLFEYEDYPKTSAREYFAESFAQYFLDPMKVREKAPQTFDYIRDFIERID